MASPRWPSRRKGAELTPNEDELYDRHSEELQSSGAMVLAFALEDISKATSLRGDIITDKAAVWFVLGCCGLTLCKANTNNQRKENN